MEWNEKSFANNKLNISLWKRIATTQNAAVLKGYAFKEKSSECCALSLSFYSSLSFSLHALQKLQRNFNIGIGIGICFDGIHILKYKHNQQQQ